MRNQGEMLTDWNILSDELQLAIAAEAMRKAAAIIADQADTLAEEMDDGAVPDAGGPDALRLLAQIIRLNETQCFGASSRKQVYGQMVPVLN
ncbi:hypothetical protein [Acidisphaera sp. L21]|uniref:hypothetical protein n=1 Tax=Acidisphaera sp. L21 TaxID=1641851 RepID=UPI00131BCE3D|nr:hypothetical protein [Acidisphaera sp. L21]